jgi:hypothetical protein
VGQFYNHPYEGGAPTTVDDVKARALPGVTHVVKLPEGVGVIGTSVEATQAAKELLQVTWSEAPGAAFAANVDLMSSPPSRDNIRLQQDRYKSAIAPSSGCALLLAAPEKPMGRRDTWTNLYGDGRYPTLGIRCGEHMRDRLFEIRLALAEAAGEDVNSVSMSRVLREAVDLMHRLICQRETLTPPERPKADWSREYWREEPRPKKLRPEVESAREDFLRRNPHLR